MPFALNKTFMAFRHVPYARRCQLIGGASTEADIERAAEGKAELLKCQYGLSILSP